jgi:hypothetical protein
VTTMSRPTKFAICRHQYSAGKARLKEITDPVGLA